MNSLSRQAGLAAVGWAVGVFVIGTLALIAIFDRIATRQFDDILRERLIELTIAVADSDFRGPSGGTEITLGDPAYRRAYSGRYWQLETEEGEIVVSLSLFDSRLALPKGRWTDIRVWEVSGPQNTVRGLSQWVTLEDGRSMQVAVAESLAGLAERRRFAFRYASLTFIALGVLGGIGALILMMNSLRPLKRLSADVRARWDQGDRLEPTHYPTEIRPLIDDINVLIDRNQDIIDRARRQSADMAHSLKTPVAALQNELRRLSAEGGDTGPADEILEGIDRQVSRSLSRMRAVSSSRGVRTEARLREALDRLARLFERLPQCGQKTVVVDCGSAVSVSLDSQDLEELLGNILENAFQWAKLRVEIRVTVYASDVIVTIEDDGPGIAEAERKDVLVAGKRLDTRRGGTGLGLTIASDLVQAYGGEISLERSTHLGGLCVRLKLPRRSRRSGNSSTS